MSEQKNHTEYMYSTTSIQKHVHVNGHKECTAICKYTSTQIMHIISQKSQLICYIWRQPVRSARNRTQWFNMGNTLSVYELYKDIEIIYIILASALLHLKYHHTMVISCNPSLSSLAVYDMIAFNFFLSKKSDGNFF